MPYEGAIGLENDGIDAAQGRGGGVQGVDGHGHCFLVGHGDRKPAKLKHPHRVDRPLGVSVGDMKSHVHPIDAQLLEGSIVQGR